MDEEFGAQRRYDWETELRREQDHNGCRTMAGALRNADLRWAAPHKTTVTAKGHGAILVPCMSPFSAILCAADEWGVPWSSLEDVTVGDPKAYRANHRIV